MKKGWEVRSLGEVVDVLDKLRKPITKRDRKPGPYPYYGATGIVDTVADFIFDEPLVLVGEDGAKWDAGEKTAFAISGKAWVNNHAHVLRPKRDLLDDNWLVQWLVFSDLSEFITGLTVPKLNQGRLREIPIPLPPLEEQKQIVAVLDEAFEGLARARANAEDNLQNAQSFFLSALRDIFSNDSHKWENDSSAESLDEQAISRTGKRTKASTQTGGRAATLRPLPGDYSLSVLDNNIPSRKGWRWTLLTSIARLESGHTPSRKRPEYWGGDVPWIGIKDARDHHGSKIYNTNECTNQLGINNSSARILPENSVCLSRTASVGYVTIMGRAMATSQDFVNWICGEAVSPEFLMYLFLAQGEEIRRFASGSVHQTIYFPEVKAFHICHPPRRVQEEICQSLNKISKDSKRLTSEYEHKIAEIDVLKQSILQKAFAGELT